MKSVTYQIPVPTQFQLSLQGQVSENPLSNFAVSPNFAVLFDCAILFEQVDGCWDFFVNPKTNIPKKWHGFMSGSPVPPPPPEDFLSSHVDLPLLSWKILISPNNLGINSK